MSIVLLRKLNIHHVAIALLSILFVTTARTAWAATETVNYIDADGTQKSVEATVIEENTNLYEGWYVVTGNVNWHISAYVNGDVHLILGDDASLTINGKNPWAIYTYGSLTIYGQTLGTGTLTAIGTDYGIYAGANVTINGGTVNATGGIGIQSFENVTINGGTVNATGSTGIHADGTITLGWTNATDRITASCYTADGTVTIATDKVLTDGSGNFYAPGSDLSGIGGKTLRPAVAVAYINADGTTQDPVNAIVLTGSETSLAAGWYVVNSNVSYDHTITLTGDVTLILKDGCTMNVGTSDSRINDSGIGNTNYNIDIYAQSLGTGKLTIYNSSTYSGRAPIAASALTINGGIITADASGTNAIYAKNVAINGGNVTANGHDSGIFISSGDIIISGGTVNATAGTSHSGINAIMGNVAINGGNVTATGGTYGIRANEGDGNITLGWNKPTDRISITANSYYGTVKVADGKKLYNGDGTFLSGIVSDLTALNGKTLQPALSTTYVNADGSTHDAVDAIVLSGSETSLVAGTYVAKGELSYASTITLTGDVTLILADNCHMNVGTSGEGRINDYGINLRDDANLAITSQSLGDDMGTLGIYTKGMVNHGINVDALTINGGHVTADVNGDYASALNAGHDALTINGGTVSATATGSNAIYACGSFNYNGGVVTATAVDYPAIRACGNYYAFNWRTPADRITIGATGLDTYGTPVRFNRLFTDADDPAAPTANSGYYGGTYTGTQLDALAGKTLGGTTSLVLADAADNTPRIAAASAVDEELNIAFTRTFKANQPSTFCVPFSFTPDEATQGKVYNFGGVDNNWRVQMNRVKPEESESTVAFTPYAFIPAIPEGKQAGDNVEVTFTGTSNITAADITAEGENPHTVDQGNWAFHGTYKRIDWQESYGRWYGFNAADGVFSHCIDGAYFPGLRCYLVYNTPASARSNGVSSDDVIPNTLKVVFNNGNGLATYIDTIDTNTGDNAIDNDSWYSIDGRKLPTKPTKKGLYIHNGKKIVIR